MFNPIAVIRRVVKEARIREKYEGAPKQLTPLTPVTPVTPLKPLKPLKVEKTK
jgi:hypothetical protein